MKLLGFLLALLLSCSLLATENLAIHLNQAGQPTGWSCSGAAKVEAIDGKLQISASAPGRALLRIELKPEWKHLRLSAYIKTKELIPGDQGWMNGRLAMRFFKAPQEPVGAYPKVFGFQGTTEAQACVRIYEIPEGATYLVFTPGNYGKSGSVVFSDVRIEPVDLESLGKDAIAPGDSSEEALWKLDDAYRDTNNYRESISLNGLWRFSPSDSTTIPAQGSGWGWFKVPGIWPKKATDSQEIHLSPIADPIDYAKLNTAWYLRKLIIPPTWTDRRIELEITMLQTCAQVWIDGTSAGEFYYPGGTLDLTGKLIQGKEHELALRVSVVADESSRQVFMAPGRLVETSGSMNCRGITGDMYLHSYPPAGHVTDAQLITLLSAKKLVIEAGLAGMKPGSYYLEAEIRDGNQVETTLRSAGFTIATNDQPTRRVKFETNWVAPKLWDIDAPQNLYLADIQLKTPSGKTIDQLFPQEFGYREFRIEGRNFLLNGKPIHLRALITRTTRHGADLAYAERQRNRSARARAAGFNHLICEDYNFAPGTVGYIDEVYREASKAGMLLTLTMPHARNFDWKLDDPETAMRYKTYAEMLIRRFQNLPGIVLYSMNHNATGYTGDLNPQKLDGIYSPDVVMQEANHPRSSLREQALLAEAIVRDLDPSRPIYHHESGNLGSIISINCYLNWAPLQERSDWLEPWEHQGVKPLMLVEWGMPHIASWSSYRGPAFIWRSPGVQCMWLNEYNATLLGEEAYRSDRRKVALYRMEDKICHGNAVIYYQKLRIIGEQSPDLHRVRGIMAKENFRALRARGVSCLLPWDQESLWIRTGAGTLPKLEPLTNLKRPGIVPDHAESANPQMIESFDKYKPSLTGESALPAMQPETGWIAGKTGDFTEKGHNFRPGETVRKQLLVLNDSRHARNVECTWTVPKLNLSGKTRLTPEAGTRAEAPIEFKIPVDTPSGELELQAQFRFDDGVAVEDSFVLNVISKATELPQGKVGLYDPSGLATPLFKELGLKVKPVRSQNDLDGIDILVIGRGGLKGFPLRLSKALRSGLKLLVMEQDYPELVRLGFRGNIHGLREVFPLDGSQLIHDWRGSSTLTPPTIDTPVLESNNCLWNWNGFSNTRVWRCGNRGNVNSVLLEKPAIGDFLPLYQGGFDLQYAVAMLWNQRVLFSQFDLSGRTESDPEAVELLRSMLLQLDQLQPATPLKTYYAGSTDGKELLQQLGIEFQPVPASLPECGLLVLGPGATVNGIADAVERGLTVLAIGLDKTELEKHFPGKFQVEQGKFFSDYASGLTTTPEFKGISNAELHWRTELAMTAFEADSVGGRALGSVHSGQGRIVAVQLAPWKFDEPEQRFRTTRRRTQFLVSRLLHNLGAQSISDGFELLDGTEPNGGSQPLTSGWIGKADPKNEGRTGNWFKKNWKGNHSWRAIRVPGNFEPQFKELKNYDGRFWYQLEFELSDEVRIGSNIKLFLGAIDDESWVWLNGKFLGEVTQKTHPHDYWNFNRTYQLKSGDLKPAENVLTVLCNDLRDYGGMVGRPEIRTAPRIPLYADVPQAGDDPYRFYRW